MNRCRAAALAATRPARAPLLAATLALALVAVAAPRAARADDSTGASAVLPPDDPRPTPPSARPPAPPYGYGDGECTTTTTTTVRCTGAAAHLAAPPPVDTAFEPPPPPPPFAAAAPPRIVLVDRRAFEGGDWHLVQGPDGEMYRERRTSTTSGALLGVGLATLGASWVGAAAVGLSDEHHGIGPLAAWPVLGAFMGAAADERHAAPWLVDGMLQAGGLVMTLVSLGAGPERVERQPVHFGALPLPGGGGLSASGRF